MRRPITIFFLLICAFVIFTIDVSAQVFQDDFTGLTTGTTLVGQSNWTKGGTGPDDSVASATPLTYAGYNGGGAEYVVMPIAGATTSRVYKTFPTPVTNFSGTTFYYSVLLRLTATSTTATGYFMSLGVSGTSTSYGAKLFAKTNGSGFNIGLSKTSNTAVFNTAVLNLNTTYLIIVQYTFNAPGTSAPQKSDDAAFLWVNPSLSSQPDTGAADCKVWSGTDTDIDGFGALTDIGNFVWHYRGIANPSGAFDGVKVANGKSSTIAWANFLNAPLAVISSKNLNFGALNVNASVTDSLTIKNAGFTTLNITSVNSSNVHFVVSPTSGMILPSDSLKFPVTYSPPSVANDSGSIAFVSNSFTSPDTVMVAGSGVQAGFSVSPTSINFGNIWKDSTSVDTVNVSNVSTSSSLLIDSVTSSNSFFVVSPLNATVGISSSAKFAIRFSPTIKGAASGNIIFYHNAPSHHDTIKVSGNGILKEPLFSVTPMTKNFGLVILGNSKMDSLLVTNIGYDSLIISNVVPSDPLYTVTPTTARLDIMASQKFYITFTPSAIGTKAASIVFTSNVSEVTDTVMVTGTGTSAVPISEARKDLNGDFIADHVAIGDTLVCVGIITTPNMGASASQTSYFIQDSTGGIDVFAFGVSATTYAIGDSVRAIGIVQQYKGLVELTLLALDDAHFTVLKHNAIVPAPKKLSLHQFVTNAENYEGQLIELDGLSKATGTWPAAPSNVSIYVMNASKADTTQMFLDLDANIGGTEPVYPINVVGFVSQYSSSTPPNNGYEICPRNAGDITKAPNPPLIVVDGLKDDFYGTLTGPADGYLQIRSYAWNDNGKPSNDNDLSAKVWAAWDTTWFYLYAEVKDDTVCGNAPQVYQEDGMELKFDAQPKDSVVNSIFPVGITALGLGSPGVVKADSLGNVPDSLKKWARRIIPGGYALEIGMKWSAIGTTEKVSVAKDSVFGLSICFHDNDSSKTRVASIEWAAVMLDAVWNTPKYLGTVKFLADNKLQFIPTNNMTPWRTNSIPYDGTDYIRTGVDVLQSAIPTTYSLSQNYPNPFNPNTTIEYALPHRSIVTIKIYSILGKEVATLISSEQSAGHYRTIWNASNMASGLYFLRISAQSTDGSNASFNQVLKMSLLK